MPITDGWFIEKNDLWAGYANSLKVKEVLFEGKSDYQDVLVFDSETFGRVLVLDGVIQFTEKDEFSYQEMICHLPISAHPNPERVLVIGGGDGGVIREAAKHPGVHSVTLCEIDQLVIDTSKKYFPTMSEGFDHPKVTVEVKDGFKYLDDHPDTFDVIIVDSTDPVGPAEALFQENFFRKMHKSLRAGGIICTQAESIWLHLDIIEKLWKTCNTIYETVRYTYTTIPTYPSGQIGFMICCKGENDLTVPKTHLPESVKLKYYSEDIHAAAFVLPRFAKKRLC